MSKGTDRRTVRVAPELWVRASCVALSRGETVSDIIRQALERYTMSTVATDRPHAVVRRAYDAEGTAGWDVLVEHATGYLQWADRAATREEARDLARLWNEQAAIIR